MVYKCNFCCAVASWFCFGTTHFCEQCHSNYPASMRGPFSHCNGICQFGKHPANGCVEAYGYCGLCDAEHSGRVLTSPRTEPLAL
jgi:E3 ubiquitin-protein ligase MYCBP2